jgi:uncharacterized protein YkwD
MEGTRKTVSKPRTAAAAKPKPAAKKAVPAARTGARKPVAQAIPSSPTPSPLERDEIVRLTAYYRAERRGFVPGYEWDDWLAAEAEVGALGGASEAPKSRKSMARKPRSG